MMQDKNKTVSRIAAVAPLPKIREILVVEGRDDTAAIKKSVDAITIETHGYGITNKTWKLIEEAYNGPGIIVFTDPDHAGEQIRRRIMEKFPEARQAQSRYEEGRYRHRKRRSGKHQRSSSKSTRFF